MGEQGTPGYPVPIQSPVALHACMRNAADNPMAQSAAAQQVQQHAGATDWPHTGDRLYKRHNFVHTVCKQRVANQWQLHAAAHVDVADNCAKSVMRCTAQVAPVPSTWQCVLCRSCNSAPVFAD